MTSLYFLCRIIMMFKPLRVPFENTVLYGDIAEGASPVRLLMLHGAGQSNAGRYRFWREDFFSLGVGSVAFDCIGHGETGGSLAGSSLQERTRQAWAFMGASGIDMPPVILGSSMGAYTAITLTGLMEVRALILNVPAVYDRAAYAVPFGPEFSRIIRQEKSWKRSDAWELLRRFIGDVFVISAAEDEVIPRELIEDLLDSAVSARSLKHLSLEGCGHRYTLEEPHRTEAFETIAALAHGAA